MVLSKEDVLAADDRAPVRVATPEWHPQAKVLRADLASHRAALKSLAESAADPPTAEQQAAIDAVNREISTTFEKLNSACVWIIPLDGHGRDRYDQVQTEKRYPRDDKGNPIDGDWRGLRAELLAMTMGDDKGELLGFSDLEIHALGKKCGAPLDRCFDVAQRISGLRGDALEEEEKN